MRKLNYLFLVAISVGTVLSSCNKDDDKELTGDEIVNSNPETPEDHKANLEQTGISLAEEISGLQSSDAMDALYSFSTIMNEDEDDADMPLKMVTQMASVSGQKSIKSFFSVLEDGQEIINMQEEWDEIAGTWEYDPTIDDFEETDPDNSDLVFMFPATAGGTSNDAKIIVHEPGWYTGPYIFADSLDERPDKLPTSLLVELFVEGNSIRKDIPHYFKIHGL